MKLRAFVILILSGSAIACHNGGGGQGPEKASTPITFRPVIDDSCDFAYSAGPAATPAAKTCYKKPGEKPTTACFIETVSFDKQFNSEHLRQILSVSAEGTVKFIESIGADVYRAPAMDGRSCMMFSRLPAPNSEISDEWASVSRELKGLAGLYLDKLPSQSSVNRGTILMIENGSRRILIHEMMHHLFAKERQKQTTNKTTEQMNMEKKVALTDFQSHYIYSCPASRATGKCTAELLKSLNYTLKVVDEIFVMFPLEESTIENLLLKALKNGSMGFVSDFTESAYSYFNRNLEKALNGYQAHDEIITSVMRDYSHYIDRTSADYEDLLARKTKISARMKEIIQLKTSTDELRRLPMPYLATQAAAINMNENVQNQESPELECGHSIDDSDIRLGL